MNRRLMTSVIAIGLVSLLVLGCSQKMEIPKAGKPRVTTLTLKAQNIPMALEYVAQTASSRQVNINARVNGFLQKRLYQEGSMVRMGKHSSRSIRDLFRFRSMKPKPHSIPARLRMPPPKPILTVSNHWSP